VEDNLKIILHLPSLVACLPFASTDNTRAYLKAVYVHWKDGQTQYVATDGHRLCLAKPSINHVTSAEGVFGKTKEEHKSFIISSEDIKEIVRFWDKKTVLAVGKMASAEVNGNRLIISSFDGRLSIKVNPIDATYPDYTRVIPPQGKHEIAGPVPFGLNMSYLADLRKVGAIFSHPRSMAATVHFYGAEAPVKFTMKNPDGDEATCVIMPMRI